MCIIDRNNPPPNTPILIDIAGNGYRLTNVAAGVVFDIRGNGTPGLVAWTSPRGDDGWLVWDRNGNGVIDDGSEMFGNAFELPNGAQASNGFEALGAFDHNADGVIDSLDAIYGQLRIWVDSDHNGWSDPSELFRLDERGLVRISTLAKEGRRRDANGNWFLLRAQSWWSQGATLRARYVYDVWLASEP